MNKPDTLKSHPIRVFIGLHFFSKPLYETKQYKDSVLDIGCGWGNYFSINPLAHGIDLDKKCVSYLQSKGYKVLKGDITNKLPFNDNTFRCAIAQEVLEHLELNEIDLILNETYRILQRNGVFLIIIPNKKGFEYGFKINAGHKHFVLPEEIFKLSENKFILKKHYTYPFKGLLGKMYVYNKEVLVLCKL